ncbi:hypothetical protein [Echinimonas agarilytica]|uniref:Uncharacterized protein n=1 Tax=Echinimonas agarilytica TaxID=1215918 RepID=A0AA42B7U0_9GAMM|nr:hypothetical protein [Echinimonas agarilytica]MCM2680575.1 hypothetical protein [Echinimonas agarilytica]
MSDVGKEQLGDWVIKHKLKSKEAAKILCISASKMSEYLNGKRKVPSYIMAHIDTLERLTDKKLVKLIRERTGRE